MNESSTWSCCQLPWMAAITGNQKKWLPCLYHDNYITDQNWLHQPTNLTLDGKFFSKSLAKTCFKLIKYLLRATKMAQTLNIFLKKVSRRRLISSQILKLDTWLIHSEWWVQVSIADYKKGECHTKRCFASFS